MHDEPGRADSGGTSGGGAAAELEQEPLSTVRLSETHRTNNFVCSKSARVQGFFANEAPIFLEYNYCRIFILPDSNDPRRILGFYTLSPGVLKRDQPSKEDQDSVLSQIPIIPMMLIGFMGRDDTATVGTGEALLVDSARRVQRSEDIAAWGLMLNAEDGPKNTKLWKWYREQGFEPTEKQKADSGLMYAPLWKLLA